VNPDNHHFFELFRSLCKPGQDPSVLAFTFDEVEDPTDPVVENLASTLVYWYAHQVARHVPTSRTPGLRMFEHHQYKGDYTLLVNDIKDLQAALQAAKLTSFGLDNRTHALIAQRIPNENTVRIGITERRRNAVYLDVHTPREITPTELLSKLQRDLDDYRLGLTLPTNPFSFSLPASDRQGYHLIIHMILPVRNTHEDRVVDNEMIRGLLMVVREAISSAHPEVKTIILKSK